MTALATLFMLLAIIIFVITRQTYVFASYDGELRLQFHLVFFALHLSEREDGDGSGRSAGFSFYTSLLGRLRSLAQRSAVAVETVQLKSRLALPFPFASLYPASVNAGVSLLLAYLFNNSKKLKLDDNVFISAPDSENDLIRLRLYTELYNLLFTLTLILLDLHKSRIKYKRKNKKNVGN